MFSLGSGETSCPGIKIGGQQREVVVVSALGEEKEIAEHEFSVFSKHLRIGLWGGHNGTIAGGDKLVVGTRPWHNGVCVLISDTYKMGVVYRAAFGKIRDM